MKNNQQNKKMMAIAVSNLFIVFLGMGLVIPVMPSFMHMMKLSGTTMGYLVAAYAIAQLVVSPIAGRCSDKFGRKKMIVIGMLIFSISELIYGLGTVVSMLYISRILGGVAAAFIMPSVMAFVADITTLEERPKAMGWVSGAISGGFIIGPGVGGFLGEQSIRMPFFAASILGAIGFFLALVFLKEPEHVIVSTIGTEAVSMKKLLTSNGLVLPFIVILIASFGLASFESIYSIFVDVSFGFTTRDIAIVITGSGFFALIAQVLLFDSIVKRIGEIGLIRISLLMSTLFVVVISFTSSYWFVILATFVVFLSFDLIRPAITTYLSKHAGNNQGAVSGLNSALTSIGNIIGPILSGSLLDINTHYPYYVVIIILSATFIVTLVWKE